ncbi:hypothetical protein YC2023_045792 [Brassica napus]
MKQNQNKKTLGFNRHIPPSTFITQINPNQIRPEHFQYLNGIEIHKPKNPKPE